MARNLPPRRLLTLTAVIASLCCCAVASAAALNGVQATNLSVGAATVLDCDADGVTVAQVTTLTTVTDLSVGDIDAACVGGDLTVTLSASDGSVAATAGPVTVTGTPMVVPVAPSIDIGAYVAHHVRIIGP